MFTYFLFTRDAGSAATLDFGEPRCAIVGNPSNRIAHIAGIFRRQLILIYLRCLGFIYMV
jgi:hypothetical protein